MPNSLDKLALARQKIREADALLIGAGAGLSTAAGLVYDGEDWTKNFADFIAKYHFPNLYYGGFGPFEDACEMWAFWSRFIMLERYLPGPLPLYRTLLRLVQGKNYFVLTTNVDHCFQKAGFDKWRLFYTQGDYGLFQCSVPCHNKTYDNQATIEAMFRQQNGMKIPGTLIPKCPVCGKPLSMNLRSDSTFVQDEGWHQAEQRYEEWLAENYADHRIVYLELGVGENTPGIIKYPFWRLTSTNPNAFYIALNQKFFNAPMNIEKQSLIITGDLKELLPQLLV